MLKRTIVLPCLIVLLSFIINTKAICDTWLVEYKDSGPTWSRRPQNNDDITTLAINMKTIPKKSEAWVFNDLNKLREIYLTCDEQLFPDGKITEQNIFSLNNFFIELCDQLKSESSVYHLELTRVPIESCCNFLKEYNKVTWVNIAFAGIENPESVVPFFDLVDQTLHLMPETQKSLERKNGVSFGIKWGESVIDEQTKEKVATSVGEYFSQKYKGGDWKHYAEKFLIIEPVWSEDEEQ